MADLVLGLASSHSPQLSTPAEGWAARGERDKGHIELIGTDGITSNLRGTAGQVRRGADCQRNHAGKVQSSGTNRTRKPLPRLSRKLYEANLDVLVMVGDDQGIFAGR